MPYRLHPEDLDVSGPEKVRESTKDFAFSGLLLGPGLGSEHFVPEFRRFVTAKLGRARQEEREGPLRGATPLRDPHGRGFGGQASPGLVFRSSSERRRRERE